VEFGGRGCGVACDKKDGVLLGFVSFHERFVVDESIDFEFFSAVVRDSISKFRHRYCRIPKIACLSQK
jgi:hypothetical protein